MIKYLKYIRYLAVHKWFVFVYMLRRGYLWLGIIHDWSKILPSEIIDYTNHFYTAEKTETAFQRAWNLHKKRNKHHWQYWVDKDGTPTETPKKYVIEMVCDWDACGRAKPDGIGTKAWYEKFKDKMVLHPNTKRLLEELIYGSLSN